MKVFRIQDCDGRGPWEPGFSGCWVEDRPDHENLQPWFYEIGPVHEKAFSHEHIGCGCATIEQLRRWITESEYRQLLNFGYKAVTMPISRILGESDIQCLFTRLVPLKINTTKFDLYPPREAKNENN